MELSKKTTILFSNKQFMLLKHIAELQKTSIGDLIRRACEHEYGLVHEDEAINAVDRLTHLNLPVGEVSDMKEEVLRVKPN